MKNHLIWLSCIAATAFVGAGCGTERRPHDVREICDNGVDDDDDRLIDCADPDCAAACATGEVCDNGVDDDGDGRTDCDDLECVDDCTSGEVCDNGRDDDGDGAVDCADSECAWDPACHGREVCDNGIDDDGDGLVDCEDPICETSPHCREVCDNGVDDDGNGLVDCADPDCALFEDCREVCDNGIDDDGNDLADCDDPSCAGYPGCIEVCDNGVDDDGNGLVDCADPDCADAFVCREVCDNGIDDDADGETDCGDPDCAAHPECQEVCDNRADDDGDGLIDCLDPSCDFDDACVELCNGVDDDGDGRIDEFPSDPEIGAPCYGGEPEYAGVGQCERGETVCGDGALFCEGWVPPLAEELCDGLDNDCDGAIPADELAEGCGTTVAPGESTLIELRTEMRNVDVHFNVDTTGSMGGELRALRTSLSSTIVPDIRALLPTANFGVSIFEDYPISPFGAATDMPFVLHQRITRRVLLVQTAIDALLNHSGADGPESGMESLYQIATGAGTSWSTSTWSPENCHNGWDDDRDGDADCSDLDCFGDPRCPTVVPTRVEECRNERDDDGDGYVDCRDPDCVGLWMCRTETPFDCGNGRIDRDEECDDGNTEDGDGCDEECNVEDGCGNALLERGDGEQCDDGNTEDGDGCSSTCRIEVVCGDGVAAPTEMCDDGNTRDGDGCSSTCLTAGRDEVPAFDWAVGFDPALGHGTIGGVGFREGALPIIVHVTDNSSHIAAEYLPSGIDAHTTDETVEAIHAIGARVVGVRSGATSASEDPFNLRFPLGWAMATDAVVPVCAFEGAPGRAAGTCADDECCTGLGGAGVDPFAGDLCPLVFEIREDGSGLDRSVVAAIDALSRFVQYTLTAVPRDDPTDGVDARCFIESLEIASSLGPEGPCEVVPVPTDTDGDGLDDTLEGATPRTRVTFEITAINEDVNDIDGDGDTREPCAGRGAYGLYLDIVADGATVVTTRRIEVVVP